MNNWDAMVTNPAPLVLPNGSALLFFRGTRWPIDGLERIGLAKSEDGWKGPYGRVQDQPLWDPNNRAEFVEDPHVWQVPIRCSIERPLHCSIEYSVQSPRGFHLLSHGHWDENGYYACATKAEGPWKFRIKPSYTNVLHMTNGTNVALVQRERPQVMLSVKVLKIVLSATCKVR